LPSDRGGLFLRIISFSEIFRDYHQWVNIVFSKDQLINSNLKPWEFFITKGIGSIKNQ